MLGAVFGDIVGSCYEFHNIRTKNFDVYNPRKSFFTDDTVMTFAVASAIINWDAEGRSSYERLSDMVSFHMRGLGNLYPHRGYGGHFQQWLEDPSMKAYGSCGNGAAMRISPVGWAARTLEECLEMSRAVTKVTHNHPEGIKGAMATAAQVFLARQGMDLRKLRIYQESTFYALGFDYNWYHENYRWSSLCDGTCQPAFVCLYESRDFEDCIRNCISIGGDSDTIAAIAGGIAEAVYGMTEDQMEYALSYLDKRLRGIYTVFSEKYMK